MATWKLTAFNNATDSENRIHADDVARDYGFRGGLVPGVTVYAYVTHPAVEAIGPEWIETGGADVRFLAPCYDGNEVTVSAEPSTDDGFALSALSVGDICASGHAWAGSRGSEPPDAADYSAGPLEGGRIEPEMSPLRAMIGKPLGALDYPFDKAKSDAYLESVRETLPIYSERGWAHPGFILSTVNFQFAASVSLGPWIHAGSEVQHFSAVEYGDQVSVRSNVADVFERKGHEFVDIDVAIFANGDRPIASVAHRSIYKIRPGG